MSVGLSRCHFALVLASRAVPRDNPTGGVESIDVVRLNYADEDMVIGAGQGRNEDAIKNQPSIDVVKKALEGSTGGVGGL